MDFSKVVDKVALKRLLLKLNRFGINNDIIKWIGSFLSNRTQRIVLDGKESDSSSAMSGVLQCFVLAPCLFLLYVNYMPNMIRSDIRLFAEDTIMYINVSYQTDCQSIQNDVTKF